MVTRDVKVSKSAPISFSPNKDNLVNFAPPCLPIKLNIVPRYWAMQRSWFARVNALCNLSHKKSREVAAHFQADF